MKPRSRAGREASKARHRKALKPKRSDAPKTASSPAPIKDAEVARLTNELNEAREQQSATSEVLRIISNTPSELDPALTTILAKATKLCQATFGVMYLVDGHSFRTVATHNAPQAFAEARRRNPMVSMTGKSGLARLATTKRPVHIADVAEDPAYRIDLQRINFVTQTGARSTAQAVIAIENARLLNELRQRTDDLGQRTADLTEALELQTATSEVLKVISGSLGDLGPVFAAMLESATRLCEASFGSMQLREGDGFRRVAMHNAPVELLDFHRGAPVISIANAKSLADIVKTKAVIQVPDLQIDDPETPLAKYAGARTLLVVPLLKDHGVIGAFGLFRREVRAFSEKQIAVVVNFAAQAVIAIENARLLNELRQRTTDLTEALEQQTATSDVLSIISSSPSDLQPVFLAILKNATRICEAKFGFVYRYDGQQFQPTAQVGAPKELVEFHSKRGPFRPEAGSMLDQIIRTKEVGHTPDIAAETFPVAAAKIAGARSTMAVPMLKDGTLVGALVIYRLEVRPFTDKQISLVRNFAAQAVIAIENARLLNELRQRTTDLTERTADLTEALEQQTATSEVLQVISSSPGNLEPVFTTMLENAVRICDATFGTSTGGTVRPCIFLHRIIRRLLSPKLASIHRYVPIRKHLSVAWWRTKQRFTQPIWQHCRATLTAAIPVGLGPSNLGACGRFSLSRC